ncbi:V-type proton ATPase subunit E2 [Olea europaea subsp. europaea]|uniref:V-type proton ATPase subunit E2 n=1 Tax=Olea europaea subsp. europaea TaxID=158383 RepID=A0A8S0SED8_OLEEU|nr:V-type proton ATPase subunit E2 [Olea europaea subsp. europaea]
MAIFHHHNAADSHAPSCSGGVVLASQDGKIVCENTLNARLDVVFRQKLPKLRSELGRAAEAVADARSSGGGLEEWKLSQRRLRVGVATSDCQLPTGEKRRQHRLRAERRDVIQDFKFARVWKLET